MRRVRLQAISKQLAISYPSCVAPFDNHQLSTKSTENGVIARGDIAGPGAERSKRRCPARGHSSTCAETIPDFMVRMGVSLMENNTCCNRRSEHLAWILRPALPAAKNS